MTPSTKDQEAMETEEPGTSQGRLKHVRRNPMRSEPWCLMEPSSQRRVPQETSIKQQSDDLNL